MYAHFETELEFRFQTIDIQIEFVFTAITVVYRLLKWLMMLIMF